MNRTTIFAVGAALLLLVGAMPAAAAAAPADEPVDNQATDDRSVGPSGGLPGPVPDFVSGIHDTINSFLNGEIDNLGKALSDMLGGQTPADSAPATADA
ncbi:hypothetical protein EGH24_05430 [Halonotius terrestris]|uniref:Uncharacterized protein n=1 Tax=Halonotius terrestris TaxID=2487750 RepID=A0A8J8PAH4_9EURY|nr:hypothetical protein [Halonotius terrestris]TQQ82881.1 hypothetical protein EGH24_05430 [Halonotius terrestris]